MSHEDKSDEYGGCYINNGLCQKQLLNKNRDWLHNFLIFFFFFFFLALTHLDGSSDIITLLFKLCIWEHVLIEILKLKL